MADTKISALTALDNADLAADDVLPIVDTNAVATKKITVANLLAGSPSNPNVQQSDIGTDPNQVPLNQYLGDLAYQDAENIAGDVGVGGDLQVDGVINNSVKIDTSGNVGIGTSSPTDLLQIASNTNTAKGIRVLNTNAGLATYASIYFGGATSATDSVIAGLGDNTTAYGGSRSMVLGTNQSTPVVLITGAAERARIDSSGNVGIGTTSPSASAILDAQSTTKGVRMPNMTTAQKNAIASPAAGLMVFDTTLSKLCVYTGVAWETVTSI